MDRSGVWVLDGARELGPACDSNVPTPAGIAVSFEQTSWDNSGDTDCNMSRSV
jgi:hypothetical protein